MTKRSDKESIYRRSERHIFAECLNRLDMVIGKLEPGSFYGPEKRILRRVGEHLNILGANIGESLNLKKSVQDLLNIYLWKRFF